MNGNVLGVLTTRNEWYHPNGRLLEAAAKLGVEARLIHPANLLPGLGSGPTLTAPVSEIQVIIPRIGSTIDESELAVVHHLELMDIPALNGFNSIVLARDKFLALQRVAASGLAVPQTLLLTAPDQAGRAMDLLNGPPIVLKTRRGRQGSGVSLAHSEEEVGEFLTEAIRRKDGIVAQEFIAAAAGRDIRVVVVDGRAVAAMTRQSDGTDFRANVALGGRGSSLTITDDLAGSAIKAAGSLGLDVAGVDFLPSAKGLLVIEVNYTPGFRELERVTGIDVAEKLINAARLRIDRSRARHLGHSRYHGPLVLH
ncbi:MAG: RimK family alpha-L-glutamate ligase [Deltaproteobacteria bacterium]|nr:RimK family alpha-L-glutamate ligase [Deltaproteobacteria bacterium]